MDSAKEFRGSIATFGSAKQPAKVKTQVKPSKKSNISTKKIVIKAKPLTSLRPKVKPGKLVTRKPVVSVDKRKATVTQMDLDEDSGNVKVNVSKLDFPELDDFTDDSLPEEFRRFQRVESTGLVVEKVSISFAGKSNESET